MTSQIPESLHYEGEILSMCSEPLNDYFKLAGINPNFESLNTALWRGYVGTWEILERRLYLLVIDGTLENGTEINLESFFPGFPKRVFAHWYSGTIRVPRGKNLEYVHMGYGSRYEEDLLITLRRGVVTKTEIRRNGTSDNPDSHEGYGISAFTVFTRKEREDDSEH